MQIQYTNLEEKQYNMLTGVRFVGKHPKKRGAMWLWKCDCGNEVEKLATLVVRGKIKSCGCIGNCVEGERYNKLTAVRFIRKDEKSKRSIWLWKCDCEKEVESTVSSVRSGNRKSCGCQRTEKATANLIKIGRKPEGESCRRTLFMRYKQEAKNRGYEFTLTEQETTTLFQQRCYYCDAAPSNKQRVSWNNDVYTYTGIDRIDSTVGYTNKNVVASCIICNKAKQIMSNFEFLEWVKRVYRHSVECK